MAISKPGCFGTTTSAAEMLIRLPVPKCIETTLYHPLSCRDESDPEVLLR